MTVDVHQLSLVDIAFPSLQLPCFIPRSCECLINRSRQCSVKDEARLSCIYISGLICVLGAPQLSQ